MQLYPHPIARTLSAQAELVITQPLGGHARPFDQVLAQGGNPDIENGWTPTFREPDVSAFSGAAAPLAVPPGRGGLQPNLSLTYSSAAVDGLLDNITPGWVGLGWSLEAIDIVRTNVKTAPGSDLIQYDNDFLLTLNSAAYRYDANGNMALCFEGGVSTSQVFDVENRRPDGSQLFTPFADYERQVGANGSYTIHHKRYLFGGEVIAIRVAGDPNGANNGLFYC